MNLKQEAAEHALAYIQSGMVLGLGSGSTFTYVLDGLAKRLRSGELRDVAGVPASEATAARARALGIPLVTLDDHPRLHLAIDGADEVDPALDLIKGLGRALLREKIVAIHASRLVIAVDETKVVDRLGARCPLPVEIVRFGTYDTVRWLNTLGCRAELWLEDDGTPIVTDNGNHLVRCWFPNAIPDPHALARTLADRPGVVEHGLFLGFLPTVVVGTETGVRILEP